MSSNIERNRRTMTRAERDEQMRAAVRDLGSFTEPSYVRALGFSQRAIERAVRDGVLRWTRDGRLVVEDAHASSNAITR